MEKREAIISGKTALGMELAASTAIGLMKGFMLSTIGIPALIATFATQTAFIIGALQNGMVLMNLNTWIQDIVLGIVLVLAVGFDCYQKKKRAN